MAHADLVDVGVGECDARAQRVRILADLVLLAAEIAAGAQHLVDDRGVEFALVEVYALPILNTVRSQTAHLPRVAGLPFLSVTSCASLTSRWARHFRQ